VHVLETHKVLHQKIPIRIQEYLVGIFKTVTTKSAIKKAIKKELILVNGSSTSTAHIVVDDDIITLLQSEEESNYKQLQLDLEVIYEDDYLAIINKPAGILVSGNKFKTVDNALLQNLKKSSQSDAVRPRPVHRLDYPTTGCLLVGKTSSSIQALNELFEQKKIQKTYHAITIGQMKSSGVINSEIDGKQSESYFQVLETVESKRFQYLNFVELSPKTGRRHQLRIHLSSLGNPILGDQEYGKEDLILKGKGLYLHASSLEFTHPFTQEQLEINSPIPSKFKKIFEYI
tara:strand:- start:46307 stop:47170 length:864 start_codon:yes stop_codon:yes gene_type:complete